MAKHKKKHHKHHHHHHHHHDVQKEPSPLTEINIEMHSMRGSTNTGGYNDNTLYSESTRTDFEIEGRTYGDEDFEMVSDITAFTRAVDLGPQQAQDGGGVAGMNVTRSKAKAMIIPCLAFVVCVVAVILVSISSGRKNDADVLSSTTMISSSGNTHNNEQSGTLDVNIVDTTTSTQNSELGPGRIIEFTVANLKANTTDCTHNANNQHIIQCIPTHNNPTMNKFRIQLHPEWAPLGVQRFEYLTTSNFWEEVRIFRVMTDFVAQFGLNSDPAVQASWSALGPIQDDPVVASNDRGTVSFATSGENTRTTQVFINTADNGFLDEQGFAPIGEVLDAGDGYGGMEVVDAFYSDYREQPDQGSIREEGGEYLEREFPLLSYFVKAEFVDENDVIFDRR